MLEVERGLKRMLKVTRMGAQEIKSIAVKDLTEDSQVIFNTSVN